MLLFLLLPWFKINGQPAVQFDLDLLQFHVFGMTLFPQDFNLIAGLFMVAAFGLFFMTSWMGRIWCGFLCPQTVWMFGYVWIEEKIEGTRNQRMKLDQQPWSLHKLIKKSLKHGIWLLVAFFSATSFVAYFVPVVELYRTMVQLQWSGTVSFWVGLFTICTYGNAGWLREKMCHHMCPYARFQSVMFDRDTLVVAYDEARGEGRGKRKRKDDPKALGDCVDCNLCVDVCPVGIDIRDGLQYECIDCGACVDACNQTMRQFNYPLGLISYTSEAKLAGQGKGLLRPKIIGYALISVVVVSAMIFSVVNTVPLELSVSRDRNVLYRVNNNDDIENSYQIKLLNKSTVNKKYQLAVDGVSGIGSSLEQPIEVAAGETLTVILTLTAAPDDIKQSVTKLTIFVEATDNPDIMVSSETRFYAI
jgi:cytochrome c oxidase accessory protein FixG